MKRLKAGIVGCGAIATVHANVIKELGFHKLTAFADIKKERAEAFAEKYGGNAYDSLEKLLECEDIDVIHICTPHYLHVPMAIYGLEHNVHVFMEKPPVISMEQYQKLKERNKKRQLGICFQNRYNLSIKLVKRMIGEGKTGKILGARGVVTWSRDAAYYKDSGWRGEWQTEGGGVLINQSIHTMDLLNYLVGRPLSIEANMTNHHLKDIIEVEDTLEAYIDYGEAKGIFYATTAYCANIPPLIELSCEHMTIRIENLEVTCYMKDGSVIRPTIEKKNLPGKDYWGRGHYDCIAEFYDCIAQNKQFNLNPETLEDTICLMLGAYRSAKEKCVCYI